MVKLTKYAYLLWRGFLYTLGVSVATVVTFLTLVSLLIQLQSVRSVLLTAVENAFSEQFQGKISIVSLDGFFPFELTANSIQGYLPDEEGTEVNAESMPFFIEKLEFDVDFLALFFGEIRLKRVHISDAYINLEQKAETLNLTQVFTSNRKSFPEKSTDRPINTSSLPTDTKKSTRFNWYAPEIRLTNVAVKWNVPKLSGLQSVRIPEQGTVLIESAQLFGEQQKEDFYLDMKEVHLTSRDIQPGSVTLSAQFYQDTTSIELSKFELKSPKSNLKFMALGSYSDKTKPENLTNLFHSILEKGRIEFVMNKSWVNLQEWSSIFPYLKPYKEILETEIHIIKEAHEVEVKKFVLATPLSAIKGDGLVTITNKWEHSEFDLDFSLTDVSPKLVLSYVEKNTSISEQLHPFLVSGRLNTKGKNGRFEWNTTLFSEKTEIKSEGKAHINSLGEVLDWDIQTTLQQVDMQKFTRNYEGKLARLDVKAQGKGLHFPESLNQLSLELEKANYGLYRLDKLALNSTKGATTNLFLIDLAVQKGNTRIQTNTQVDYAGLQTAISTKVVFSKLNVSDWIHTNTPLETQLTGKLAMNVSGIRLDSLHGDFSVDVTQAQVNGVELEPHQLYADLNRSDSPTRQLRLTSTIADLNVVSTAQPSEWKRWFRSRFGSVVEQLTHQVFPKDSLRTYQFDPIFDSRNQLTATLNLKNATIAKAYFPQLPVEQLNMDVQVSLEALDREFLLNARVDKIRFQQESKRIHNANAQLTYSVKDVAHVAENQLGTLRITADSVILEKNRLYGFDVLAQQENKKMTMEWLADSLLGTAVSMKNELIFGETLQLLVNDIVLQSGNEYWKLKKTSQIEFNSNGKINISDFEMENKNQRVAIRGVLSNDNEDQVMYSINQLEVETLFSLLPKQYAFSGELNAEFTTKTLFSVPQFEGLFRIDGLKLQNRIVGDVNLRSVFKPEFDKFEVSATIKLDSLNYPNYYKKNGNRGNLFEILGYVYRPTSISRASDTLFYADVDIKEADMWILTNFIPPIYTKVEGKADGKGFITGGTGWFDFSSKFNLKQVLTVPAFLNGNMYMDGPIQFGFHEGVRFDSVWAYDGLGGKALLTGSINLGYFAKNTYKGYDLRADAERFQFLNNTFSPEVPFYGRAAGSGVITLTGPFTKPFLATQNPIRTTSTSRLSIPLLDEEKVETQTKFVEFVTSFYTNKTDTNGVRVPTSTAVENKSKQSSTFVDLFQMNLQFTAPAQTQFELVFDPVTGEVLTANGGGSLNIVLENQEFGMFGYFDVYGGDYLFMGGDLFSRKFSINDGGTLSWEGSPQNPRVNLTAVFKSRPSMQPLGIDARVPIDLILKLNGTIEALQNDFYFEIPNTTFQDPTLTTALRILNSDEQKLPQATSLLLTGSFFAVSATGAENTNTFGSNLQNNATQTGLSQLLSSQINTIINNSISNLDIDLNLTSFDQADLGIALRLFDDRLELRRDGQLINNDPNAVNQNVIGDLRASYKISRALSVEVFYRQDPSMSGFNAVQDQVQNVSGVGLQYQVQFNKWTDLPKIIWKNIKNFFGFGDSAIR